MSRGWPFRRPPADVVRAAPWSRAGHTGTVELGTEVLDWDYDSVLVLSRTVRLDGRRARLSAGLSPDARLDLSVRWASSSSFLRGRAWREAVPDEDDVELSVAVELPGDELGGALDLDTVLTLRDPGTALSPAAPIRPGSMLWSERHTTVLQGGQALFPLVVTDFEHQLLPTDAPWFLQIGDDLDAAALGSMLLLANSRHPAVVDALRSAELPDDVGRRVLSVVRTDVVRSMVEHALLDETFRDEVDYPSGSLGRVLQALFRNTFDLPTVESLRRERTSDPLMFAARVQSATELLAG